MLISGLGSNALAIPVSVQVNDAEGKPVTGVLVEAYVMDGTKTKYESRTTDEQGQVRFDATPREQWPGYLGRFNAWKSGYALAGGNFDRAGSKVVLTPGAAVEGTVVDANQKPLPGVWMKFSVARNSARQRILLYGAGPDSVLMTQFKVQTDEAGHFRMEGLPADHEITLSVRDARYISASASGRAGGEAIRFTLRPGALIQGVLLDGAGAPLAKSRVFVIGADEFADDQQAETVTDAEGRYSLTSLASGSYTVNFPLAEETKWIAQPVKVDVIEGKTTEAPPVRAQRGVIVGGTIRDAVSKAAIKGASVHLRIDQPLPIGKHVETDADGRWQARVLPGKVEVSISQLPPQFIADQGRLKRTVEAPAEGVGGIDFEVKPSPKIAGRIVDEQGKSVRATLAISQNNDEWPLQSDDTGAFTAYGPEAGEAFASYSMWSDEDSTDKWEVISGGKIQLPTRAPLKIVVRPLKYTALQGLVVDQAGAPLPSAKVKLQISTQLQDGHTTGRQIEVITDSKGQFQLEKLRSNDSVKVSADKVGYDFASGGDATKDGDNWKVTPVVLQARTARMTGRVKDAAGRGVEGAQVFAGGVETRSSADGSFTLENLPSAEAEVSAYRGDGFAVAKSEGVGPVELTLAPVTLQKQDVELASKILEEARAEAQNTKYYAKQALVLSASDDFLKQVESTKALDGQSRDNDLVRLVFEASERPTVPISQLLDAVRLISRGPNRLYGAGILGSKRPQWPDDAQTRELVADLEASANEQAQVTDNMNWQRIIGLFAIAPIQERFGGEKAGDFAFNRAYAWLLKNYPEKQGGDAPSRDDVLRVMSELVAATSPRLFDRLLEAISEPTSSEYSWTLEEGTVAIAKTRGLTAAMPFLERLRQAPAVRADDKRGGPSVEWRYARAVRRSIAEGRIDARAEALRLAQALPVDEQGGKSNRSRAIIEAAFLLPLAEARPLWRENLPLLGPALMARYAVRISRHDQPFALEMLQAAASRLESKNLNNEMSSQSEVAAFAFYEAALIPARARYRLEKGWVDSAKENPDTYRRSAYARAMARFDALRAVEWARQLPIINDSIQEPIETRRKIVQWLEADESTRSDVPFDRWGASDTWRFGDAEW
jgi:5-hydroxyisourate hydrolase-like protein (transthyretin family)